MQKQILGQKAARYVSFSFPIIFLFSANNFGPMLADEKMLPGYNSGSILKMGELPPFLEAPR